MKLSSLCTSSILLMLIRNLRLCSAHNSAEPCTFCQLCARCPCGWAVSLRCPDPCCPWPTVTGHLCNLQLGEGVQGHKGFRVNDLDAIPAEVSAKQGDASKGHAGQGSEAADRGLRGFNVSKMWALCPLVSSKFCLTTAPRRQNSGASVCLVPNRGHKRLPCLSSTTEPKGKGSFLGPFLYIWGSDASRLNTKAAERLCLSAVVTVLPVQARAESSRGCVQGEPRSP